LIALVLIGLAIWFLAHNTLTNMRVRGIQSGFDFLTSPAGFDIGERLIPYESNDPYWMAFLIGILNTLRVAIFGIVLTTILGTLLGIGRFSHNALVRGVCYAYVELFRNIPVLLQLLMWYLFLIESLPTAGEPMSVLGLFYLGAGGLAYPVPVWGLGQGLAATGALVGVVLAFLWARRARIHFEQTGQVRAMEGGSSLTPEFIAILLGLTLYTASYVAEVVRAGIASVPRGQGEAASALGLSKGQQMRLVSLPQALRVIIPPMTNQFLNLTKNSSLAVAIGYPDVISISNTAINQTGRAVECISIIMLVYLTTSLSTSGLMNWYNKRSAIKER
jgi:general L-amino acid transport system permease protein